ncbi:hypothetical protein HXP44_23190 [Streptomyces sioyaensis]|uniref:Uncharacterized protein n=1 Tax=Streptomyces sioyaensis TaxID=67364 RepID=A0A4Q1R319_9ACTN|nr:hypothetical protein [Streptomyces sioyaensis]MBM4794891.1 hypothetical protein [Streptomyces sioyaensis]RXS65613.1 hypothetical protein EST54_18120 [Streptomyces sioyaensis]
METVVTVAAILALITLVAYLINLRNGQQDGPGTARHGGRGTAAPRGGARPSRGARNAARRRPAGLGDPPTFPPGGQR